MISVDGFMAALHSPKDPTIKLAFGLQKLTTNGGSRSYRLGRHCSKEAVGRIFSPSRLAKAQDEDGAVDDELFFICTENTLPYALMWWGLMPLLQTHDC